MEADRPRIMIVEDDPAHAEAILRALERAGMAADVRVTNTLKTYREALAAGAPDIVLLDLNLPDGRAVEALTSPPEAGPFPILVMTSYGNERIAVEMMKAGALEYVVKSAEAFADMPRTVERSLREWMLLQDRKQTDITLRDNESKYQQLFELAMESVFLIDNEEGRLLEANSFASQMYGYTREEFLSLRNTDLSAEPQETRKVTTSTTPGGVILPLRWHRRKDGTVFPVEISGRYFTWKGRSVHVAAIRDITERQRAEEQIRHAKEEWESTFDSVPDLICILDEHHVIRRANRVMAARLGLRPQDMVGKTCYSLVHGLSSPPPACPHAQLVRDHLEHTAEIHEDRLGGDFLVTCAPLHDKDGRVTGAVHIARDITASKKLEAQFQQAMKMEAVGRLAGGVAHDFNNMLSVILGYTDLALRRLNPLDPLYKDLQEIDKAGRRSADITRQLLTFSRKQIVTPKVIDLNEVIAGQRNMLARLIGEDIDLRFDPAPGLWPVKVDPSQIDQILANLAVNARDAVTGVGAVTIATATVVLDETYTRRNADVIPGEYVMLTFSDTGAGMDAETRERIYEPFFTTKGEGQGTGLGLSTVYGIVTQNAGVIHVYSEPGMGTTFKVYFPRFRGEAEKTVEQPRELSLAGKETVLIVEDEEQILNLAREILSDYGYQVLTARSPGEACLLVEKHAGEIHLLVTDVIMPGMNGKELQERVTKIKPDIKTMFMSGYTANIMAHRGLIGEDVEFLQKPFSVQALAEKVRRVLNA